MYSRKYPFKVGDKFGDLTVITVNDQKRNHNGKRFWVSKVQCICGEIEYSTSTKIATYKNKCGRKHTNYGIARYNIIITNIRGNAIDRRIEWKLPLYIASLIIRSNCFYCNCEPSNIFRRYIGIKPVETFYNGIDRIDSSQGYTIENSVPCCKACNTAKFTSSMETFLNRVQRIYSFLVLDNPNSIIAMAKQIN